MLPSGYESGASLRTTVIPHSQEGAQHFIFPRPLSFLKSAAIMTLLKRREALTERSHVVPFRPSHSSSASNSTNPHPNKLKRRPTACFDRRELTTILDLYGRKVAEGEWRDYAIDMGKDTATFSVFRRTSENPFIRIEKTPKLARKQGAFAVVGATGQILKRGHDLKTVLRVLDKKMQLVKT